MLDAAPTDEKDAAPPSRARLTLAKRLADVVCLPTTRITPQERHITGDLLIEMLRDGDAALRTRCARRVSALSEAPSALVRFLGRDDISVARPILADCEALRDSDLVAIARSSGREHRRLIATRREVPELVAEAVAEYGEPDVIEALLKNSQSQLSSETIERMVADSREQLQYCRHLVRRNELRPSQGLTLFWWADTESRRTILRRFAVDRSILQDIASDVFAMASEEQWSDAVTRKALQFIERRQRNRAALSRSVFESLEDLVESAARLGLDRATVEELSYLCGIKPAAGAQICGDIGGEPLAVLCKAVGLKREGLASLWRAARRPAGDDDMTWQSALATFDSLSNEKAQTVLRYWNWALTSAFSPALAKALEAEGAAADEYSAAQRSARLVFGGPA